MYKSLRITVTIDYSTNTLSLSSAVAYLENTANSHLYRPENKVFVLVWVYFHSQSLTPQ